ncbi:MAG: carbon-nitrogen hydrolase family protein [Dehalococcoidia bacterium]|nr:carbon-nitrogen hydrolase family protein [Dehalococcoidia bacterium]MDD5494862.1 carbon-nitrogen hydrolase family protein [Dehalococcoidia bacterium]
MRDKVKIAAVQMNPAIMQNSKNLDKILSEAKNAATNGAELVVFPECALPGYVYSSREEAMPFMETVPGPATDRLAARCRELGVHIVTGLLEKDGNRCFNAAVLIGPEGLIGKYRKNHLPFLGVDRFLDRGDRPFEVHKTPIGNFGIHICYDCNFPESARVMALLGADILVLPTNWPQGRGKVAKYVVNTRAYENKVHLVAVNRVGEERGTRFIGTSKIINAWGDTLAQAGVDEEQILYAEVSLSEARQKHVVFKPGEFEMDFIRDRRPELYGKIAE